MRLGADRKILQAACMRIATVPPCTDGIQAEILLAGQVQQHRLAANLLEQDLVEVRDPLC